MTAAVLKDANDALRHLGPDHLRKLFDKGHDARKRDYGSFALKHSADVPALNHRPYITKGLFAPGDLSLIYGEGGSGKSFFAAHVFHAVARGESVLGRRVTQTRVLWLLYEGQQGFQVRQQAMNARFGPVDAFDYIDNPPSLFDDEDGLQQIIRCIKDWRFGVVVCDTLAHAIAPGDENASADMMRLIRRIGKIRAESGAHVCLIHHCGKDRDRGPRGSSALTPAVDTAIFVEKLEHHRLATVERVKDGEAGAEFAFRLNVVDVGQDQDGDAVTTCLVEEMELEPLRARKAGKLPRGAARLLEVLKRAVVEKGTAPPAELGLPGHVFGIPEEVARQASYDGAVADSDEPSARRKAYGRAMTDLLDRKLVEKGGAWVWLP